MEIPWKTENVEELPKWYVVPFNNIAVTIHQITSTEKWMNKGALYRYLQNARNDTGKLKKKKSKRECERKNKI